MKKTFLFIYKNMQIGGIETYLIRLIRKLKELKHRIIWLTPKDRIIDDGFKQDLLDGQVEVVDIHINGLNWIRHKEIAFAPNEEVIALAFDPVDFLRLETLKKSYSQVRIDNFYWVPHFAGKAYFLEEFLPNPLRLVFRRFIGATIKCMEKNNNIFYVNNSHLVAYTKRYGYIVNNSTDKLADGIFYGHCSYDEKLAFERSLRNEFNIITIGRIDFPHKAYVIGLVKAFAELKIKYDKLKLTIIGYGKDENVLINIINELPSNIKKDVNFVGKVPYDDLPQYYQRAHLNVGVASTIPTGALLGLISIPVRHYSELCEGYGFLPEAKDKITCSEPGIPIMNLIDKVINMSQEEYLNLSRRAYDTYNQKDSLLSILNLKNFNPSKTISRARILLIKMYILNLKHLISLKHKILSSNSLFGRIMKRLFIFRNSTQTNLKN